MDTHPAIQNGSNDHAASAGGAVRLALRHVSPRLSQWTRLDPVEFRSGGELSDRGAFETDLGTWNLP